MPSVPLKFGPPDTCWYPDPTAMASAGSGYTAADVCAAPANGRFCACTACPTGTSPDPTPAVLEITKCISGASSVPTFCPGFASGGSTGGGGQACSGHGHSMYAGNCVCEQGWSGADCSHMSDSMCSSHGYSMYGSCVCDQGWSGADCSSTSGGGGGGGGGSAGCHCFASGPANIWFCETAGTFLDAASCMNTNGLCHWGPTENAACQVDCSSHGHSMYGSCVCDQGWSGADCSQSGGGCTLTGCPPSSHACFTDPNDACYQTCQNYCVGTTTCSGRGHLMYGNCVCDQGWSGADCSHMSDSMCSSHGYSMYGSCVCDQGWSGADCSQSGGGCTLTACPPSSHA
jgi:hypothetical protein